AESRDADPAGETAQGCLDGCLDLVGGGLHLEGNLRPGLALEGDGHSRSVGHLGTHIAGVGAVRGPRLELGRVAPRDPKSRASTDSAIRARSVEPATASLVVGLIHLALQTTAHPRTSSVSVNPQKGG